MNQSRDMLWNLTGKRSPDILLVASCAWCVHLDVSTMFRAVGPVHAQHLKLIAINCEATSSFVQVRMHSYDIANQDLNPNAYPTLNPVLHLRRGMRSTLPTGHIYAATA